MVTAIVAAPTESHALCGLFDCLFGGCRTTYRPVTACSPCATPCATPCAPATVCNYMPQTCYRTECVNVPVTTYRCESACDPCTGCPTTVMRPVTSFVRQVRYVPYTTYRQVCNTVAAPVVAAPAMVAPAAVAPATSLYPAAPSGSCCTPTSAAMNSTYGAPAATYPAPAMPSAPMIQSAPAIPATPAPTLNGAPVITPLPRTDLRAIPDNNFNGSSSGNWTYDPDSRTTRHVAPRPTDEEKSGLVVPAVYSSPAASRADDSGWRAARR
jgi:hypothetical protein